MGDPFKVNQLFHIVFVLVSLVVIVGIVVFAAADSVIAFTYCLKPKIYFMVLLFRKKKEQFCLLILGFSIIFVLSHF